MSTQPTIKVISRGGEPPRRNAFGKVVILAVVLGLAFLAYKKWYAKEGATPDGASEQRQDTPKDSPADKPGRDGLYPIPRPEFK